MKNFKLMSTKKLNALLETATDEERVAIEEALAAREAKKAEEAQQSAETPELTAEEEAAIAAVEEAEKAEEKPAKRVAKEKATDEERVAIAEELRQNALNHKCKVVPFNSIEWVDGTIVSIIEDKRTNKVMFGIKTDDGRRIVKVHDSNLVKVLEETVERAQRSRKRGEAKDDTPWSDEEIEEAVQKVIENVGKRVSYPEAGAYGQVEENAPIVSGRITSLVPAKRTKTILYRIELDVEEGESKKFAHKVSTLESLKIEDEFDEEGKNIHDKFVNRRYNKTEAEPVVKKNEKEQFDYCAEMLEKTKAQLEKLNALLEKREAALEAAKAAYEAAVAEGKTFDEPELDEPEPDAEEETEDELM